MGLRPTFSNENILELGTAEVETALDKSRPLGSLIRNALLYV